MIIAFINKTKKNAEIFKKVEKLSIFDRVVNLKSYF